MMTDDNLNMEKFIILDKGTIDDVEYIYVQWKANRHYSILVRCPKCRKIGRLTLAHRRHMLGFVIRHKKRICSFGWTSKDYDKLKKIYLLFKKIEKI